MSTVDATTNPQYASTIKLIEQNGEAMSIKEWAERCGLTESAIRYRLKRGYSIKDVITMPN